MAPIFGEAAQKKKRVHTAGKQFASVQERGTQVRVRARARLRRNNEHMPHAHGECQCRECAPNILGGEERWSALVWV